MNTITFVSSIGSTLQGKQFILFLFIKDTIEYKLYDERLVSYEDNITYIKNYNSRYDISYLNNITEEEYFMQSVQWNHEISIDLCIQIMKLSTEHYSNNNTLIDNKITTIEY